MAEPYPEGAGWKEPTTSREAAESVDASNLRQLVRACLATHGAMTTDECAARLGLSVLSIRPRFSELRLKDEIDDSGERRENLSGRRAIVWKLLDDRANVAQSFQEPAPPPITPHPTLPVARHTPAPVARRTHG